MYLLLIGIWKQNYIFQLIKWSLLDIDIKENIEKREHENKINVKLKFLKV